MSIANESSRTVKAEGKSGEQLLKAAGGDGGNLNLVDIAGPDQNRISARKTLRSINYMPGLLLP
jgi:hypothetical protein